MPVPLSSADESHLICCVKQARDFVDKNGLAPTAAMEKVARSAMLTPGQIRMVSHAFNVGQQSYQRQTNRTALNKFASFPLVDPDSVIAGVFEPKQAEAIDSDYTRPPNWLREQSAPLVKAAAAARTSVAPKSVDRLFLLQKAHNRIAREKKACEETAHYARLATVALHEAQHELVEYFRKSAAHRLPFDVAEYAARAYIGDEAVPFFDYVQKHAHSIEKRASVAPILDKPLAMQAEPFTLVRTCIKAAALVEKMRQTKLAVEQNLQRVTKEAMADFVPPPEPETIIPPAPLVRSKAAGLLGTPAAGAFLGTLVSRGMSPIPKTPGDLVGDAQLDLEDPAHQNELRKIRTNAMLTSMLTDPDDPISGHDPAAVVRAYNELSRVAPRAVGSEASLRPLLRRSLQNHVEPFEIKEVSEIEKGLRDAQVARPVAAPERD